jgi:hypothetical protein
VSFLAAQAVFADGGSATVTVKVTVLSAIRVSNEGVVRSNALVVRQITEGFVTYAIP